VDSGVPVFVAQPQGLAAAHSSLQGAPTLAQGFAEVKAPSPQLLLERKECVRGRANGGRLPCAAPAQHGDTKGCRKIHTGA
jgi:hypothetical protein